MLVNRVKKNSRKLKSWRSREAVSCYRLYDRDIPEIPLAVDWYDGRLHVSVYSRRGELPAAAELDRLVHGLGAELHVPAEKLFIKVRKQQKQGDQYLRFARKNARFQVVENNLTFTVNLSDYLDTGLFLDHRQTRKMVREVAAARHFLNLFSYTGAFTVYAAAGGAASTSSVDLSNTYLDWAEHNLAQNGYSGKRHRFYKSDVLGFLENHIPPDGGYDLVVVDPPTVSRSNAMEFKLDLQKDHPKLLSRVLELCKPDAVIYFSTNFRRFKLNRDAIRCAEWEEITDKTIPPDFRNKRIHRSFRLVK